MCMFPCATPTLGLALLLCLLSVLQAHPKLRGLGLSHPLLISCPGSKETEAMSWADSRLGRTERREEKRLGTPAISLATEGIADPRTRPIIAEAGVWGWGCRMRLRKKSEARQRPLPPNYQAKGTSSSTLTLLSGCPSQQMQGPGYGPKCQEGMARVPQYPPWCSAYHQLKRLQGRTGICLWHSPYLT